MATPKQEKVIKLLLENLGTKNNTKTLGEILLEAGYSEAMSKNPFLVLESEGVQEGISSVVDKMEKLRDKALNEITDDKLQVSSAKDNASIADTLTKNIQLLSGKPTDNAEINLKSVNDMSQEEINEYLKNKLNGSTERQRG